MKSYCSFWCVSQGNVCLYSIPIILSPLNFRSTIYRSLMLMDSRYLYPLYNTMVTCYTFEPIFHHTSRLFSIYTTLLIIIFLFSTYLQLATKSFALSYCRHRRIAIQKKSETWSRTLGLSSFDVLKNKKPLRLLCQHFSQTVLTWRRKRKWWNDLTSLAFALPFCWSVGSLFEQYKMRVNTKGLACHFSSRNRLIFSFNRLVC